MVKDGIVLGKRYAVLSKIGAGGMADVYKGRDQMLNRYVAIKVLKKQYKEDENFVRKFSFGGTGSSRTDTSEYCKMYMM